MTTFSYTTGNPTNLTAGSTASMNDIQGPFTDLKTFINGANITDTNVSAAGIGLAKLTPLILYGNVNGVTGAILNAGSGGWSSARSAAGQYTVTFSPVFSATPSVLVMPITASSPITAIGVTTTTASVVINTNLVSTQVATDATFAFFALGVR